MALPPFIYIDTPKAWEACLNNLERHDTVCIDLESNSLYVYKEEICLIQISAGDTDYIVDPKADIDLTGLGKIVQDTAVEKVFHASEYDLILLKKQFNWNVANLFDTMWAARILGVEKIGLANILRNVFEVELDKKFQTADWGKRPLSPEMLAYAQNDTHYLHRLRDHFAVKLQEAGHWEEALESFELQSRVNLPNSEFDPNHFWNFHGVKYLEPQNQAICKALFAFREKEAEKFNRPLFKIFDNKRLVQMAEFPPTSMEQLFKTKGLPGWYVRKRGPHLLRAIREGSHAPYPRRPKRDPKPAQDILDRYDAMLTWRKETAKARGVESDIILSKEGCWKIAKGNPSNLEDLAPYGDIAGHWRIKTYGSHILTTLASS